MSHFICDSSSDITLINSLKYHLIPEYRFICQQTKCGRKLNFLMQIKDNKLVFKLRFI